MKIDILYEDDHYIIVNKPSGTLSIPDRHNEELPSVLGWLRRLHTDVFVVHRIDKETSGVLCFTKDAETHKYTSQLFEQRKMKKLYLGIVHGTLQDPKGTIDAPIMEHPVIKGKMIIHQKQGKPSRTDYEVIESLGMYSLLQFDILTGRTHQIRIHMQQIGHPIVCDPLYGKSDPVFISELKSRYKLSKNEEEERPILSRMALHAARLQFTGLQQQVIDIQAPLPKDMQAMLNQCRKWLKK